MNPRIGGGDSHIATLALPREFTKSFFSNFNRFFWNIFLITLVVHISVVFYLIQHPTLNQVTPRDIARIQRQYASFILNSSYDSQVLPDPEHFNPDFNSEADQTGTANKGTKQLNRTRRPAGAVRPAQSPNYSGSSAGGSSSRPGSAGAGRGDNLSTKGLLGLLTAGTATENTDQRAVSDVLSSDVVPDSDLDEVIASSDALTTSRKAAGAGTSSNKGTPARVDRVTKGGNIDDVLSDLEVATTTELDRSDNLIHSELSPVTTTDDKGREVNMSGARNSQDVFTVVNRHVDGIEYCFKREVRRKPDLRGKVVVRFTIKPDGTVREVKIVSSTLNSPNVERCIVSRIEHWDDFGAIDPTLGDATFRQVYTFGY